MGGVGGWLEGGRAVRDEKEQHGGGGPWEEYADGCDRGITMPQRGLVWKKKTGFIFLRLFYLVEKWRKRPEKLDGR